MILHAQLLQLSGTFAISFGIVVRQDEAALLEDGHQLIDMFCKVAGNVDGCSEGSFDEHFCHIGIVDHLNVRRVDAGIGIDILYDQTFGLGNIGDLTETESVMMEESAAGMGEEFAGTGSVEHGRSFQEGMYVYRWLIHVEVGQKTAKFYKAIILQLKK